MIRNFYHYSFYKLYKSFEASPSRYWSEWKASLVMDVLVGFLFMSFSLLYEVVTKRQSFLFGSNVVLWLFVILISVFNFFLFNYKDNWKQIVREYDSLSMKTNLIGGIVFWIVFTFIIGFLVFSFYLFSQVDWKTIR
ncbi:MAG: hypothetical protein EOP48_04925 [Sphingobacteriales bacterium]|nr:MAG: hypothetical protein EOP48_04925 [Sphingobacteriales bacterium]